MCDNDTSTAAALRQALELLPDSAPARLRSELTRYLQQLDREEAAVVRTLSKVSPDGLMDDQAMVGQLLTRYASDTVVHEPLTRLAGLIEAERRERKEFEELLSPASKGIPPS
jgi:SOS response regulatory protein OraA/RecX